MELEKDAFLEPVKGGWKFSGYKGKGGGGSSSPVEAPDSLHSISYAKIKLLWSEGDIEGPVNGLRSFYVDQTPVQNANGTFNFSGLAIDYRTGTQDQSYIPGFPASESAYSVGVEFTDELPWTRTVTDTSLSAVKVTLAVQGLSQANTSNGDINGYSVQYAIDLSTDGSAFSPYLITAFTGKTTSTYSRTHRIELPNASSGWTVRVRRITPNANSATIADRTFVQTVADVIDGKQRHPMWAVAGFQVDASQFSTIPTISAHMRGRRIKVPTNYDPFTHTYTGTWDGQFKISWTNNPAWIFYDLVTHPRYGLGENIPEGWMDRYYIYQLGRYCDEMVSDGFGNLEPRFTCNVYLQVQADAYRVLQDLASVFRGMVYWGAGTVITVADMPKDVAWTYSNGNVVNGEFTRGSAPRKSRFTSALVSWSDQSDFGRQKVEAVDDEEGILRYGINEVEISSFGCTSRAQAQRIGRWAIESSLRETRTITFSVGLDGNLCKPGDIISVADEFWQGRGISGRISNSLIEYITVQGIIVTVQADPVIIKSFGDYVPSTTRIIVDKDIVASPGDRLSVTLPSGVVETRIIASVTGRIITVTTPFSAAPLPESMWLIESSELVAEKYRVLSISENEGITFTISAVQYDEGKYSAIDDGVRLEAPPVSIIPPSVMPPPASIVIDQYEKIFQGISSTTARFTWEPVENAVEYEVQWRRDNSDWVFLPRTGTTQAELENAYTGQYLARVRAKNSLGVSSSWTSSVLTNIDGILSEPPSVTSLTTTPIVFGITVNWVIPNTPNIIERSEVWYSLTNNRADAIKLADYAYPQQSTTLQGLAAGRTFYFWVRLVDKNGTVGPWYPTTPEGVMGTSSSDATEILAYLTEQITETQLAQSLLEKIEEGDGAMVELEALKSELAAMYTIKTQLTVDGKPYMAGIGVGVENDEGIITSQILLAAARVAILDESSGNLVVPFVVQGGQVFINNAIIGNASIGSAKLANWLESDAVGPGGVPVLRLNFRTGEIQLNSPVSGGGRMRLTNNIIEVFNDNSQRLLRLGIW